MKTYLLSLDQGTTSSRCIIFDESCRIVAMAQKEFAQHFPREGWVEHDAMDIWESQLSVAKEAIKKADIRPEQIAGIGITNQRETTVVWDKKTGEPICHAIVWQCRRTAQQCEDLRKNGYTDMIQEKTGLVVDSYFSATKLSWILQNVPNAKERAENGELMFGTVDSWLIYRLTGGKVHATDPSNASRTMLFNIHTMEWDDELLGLFDIPRSLLPEVLDSNAVFGMTDPSLLGASIPICAVLGDQQAALFGQGCFEAGMAKNTYGTGAFLLMNTGSKPCKAKNGLLSSVAWRIDGKTRYAAEGSVFVCGAAIQWLRDGIGLIESAKETEALALSVSDSGGVYFVPAFVGLGAPYWDPHARGMIIGITRGTTRAHIVRAALEAMALQTADLISLMEQQTGYPLSELRVDGGASANCFLLQCQADVINKPILRPACIESTALGVAMLAGLTSHVFPDMDALLRMTRCDTVMYPDMTPEDRHAKLAQWHKAVERSLAFSLYD